MSLFTDTLRKLPAKDAAKALGFPLRTIYRWRNSQSVPNAWTQDMVVANLTAYTKLMPRKGAK